MVRLTRTAIVCVVLVTNVAAPWLQHWHATDGCAHVSDAACFPSRFGEKGHAHSHAPLTVEAHDVLAAATADDRDVRDASAHVESFCGLISSVGGSAHDPRSCAICRHYGQGQWHEVAHASAVTLLRCECEAPFHVTPIVRSFHAFAARAPPSR